MLCRNFFFSAFFSFLTSLEEKKKVLRGEKKGVPTCLYPLRYIRHVGSPDNKGTHNGLSFPQWRENKLGPHQAWFAMPCFTIIPLQKPSFGWQTTPLYIYMTEALRKDKRTTHMDSS